MYNFVNKNYFVNNNYIKWSIKSNYAQRALYAKVGNTFDPIGTLIYNIDLTLPIYENNIQYN